DGLVHVGGPVAQVMDPDGEDPLLDGLAQEGVAQGLEVLGEDGDHIEAHHRSSSPSGGVITRASLSRSTMGTMAWTKGIIASPPSSSFTSRRRWAAPRTTPLTSPMSSGSGWAPS